MKNHLAFLGSWIRAPRSIGAIAPSSAALATLITQELTERHVPVIELGPGTGVITQAISSRGVPQSQIFLVESHAPFARQLKKRYPAASVHQMDAADLADIDILGSSKAGAIISGLPLVSMPRSRRSAVIRGVARHLGDGASMYQFTYGATCPLPASDLQTNGLVAERIGRCLANLPPASVYRVRRAP